MTAPQLPSHEAEWLETDGLGGFASGLVGGWRRRRYHGLLVPAIRPPSARAVLVAAVEATLDLPGGAVALTTHRYAPDTWHPDGRERLAAFDSLPWPTWTWTLPGGGTVNQELFLPHELSAVVLRWTARGLPAGTTLRVRPLLALRDSHALWHERTGLAEQVEGQGERLRWRPDPELPAILSLANGRYEHRPDWFRNFLLGEELARGFDHVEDLWSPGEFRFSLAEEEACWVLQAEGLAEGGRIGEGSAREVVGQLAGAERRRRDAFPTALHRAGDQYLVRRGAGKTIIAGYPWFTDWGRDTFIALRGLCLASGRLHDAGLILQEWAGAVSEGMLPNRFVEAGDAPEFNAVDASLWYVIAVHEYLEACARSGHLVPLEAQQRLHAAVDAILRGYSAGTRFGIGMDEDGLLRAGQPGVQLTWMDARVGDWVVTPRIGKPVEIQALWLNALRIGGLRCAHWAAAHHRAIASFHERFWNKEGGWLWDVVDVDHVPGTVDQRFRPNQIFAVGGLPFPLLEGAAARSAVDAFESRLWTPAGPRSLASDEAGYVGRYEGGPVERDGAYHQGTVWPWLAGPFVEAWVRVRGNSAAARREARARFLEPLLGLGQLPASGQLPEIADADAPHAPRGCPFQAWSVGEALRLECQVLADAPAPAVTRRRTRAMA